MGSKELLLGFEDVESKTGSIEKLNVATRFWITS
jgi:hypothetical protein